MTASFTARPHYSQCRPL